LTTPPSSGVTYTFTVFGWIMVILLVFLAASGKVTGQVITGILILIIVAILVLHPNQFVDVMFKKS
jgi:type IV secretory pathway VirB3-like protein